MEHKTYYKFEDFDMTRKLHEAIIDSRLERPTELQLQVIPPALEDSDVLFEARSGMGKSACFAIPFLQHWLRNRTRKAMIITPTSDSVQQLGRVIVHALVGSPAPVGAIAISLARLNTGNLARPHS